MSRASPEAVSGRFIARASDLGFFTPPIALHVKLLEGPGLGSLLLRAAPPDRVAHAAEWVESFGPLRIEFGTRNVLRADFDVLPPTWVHVFHGVTLDMMHLTAEGEATVAVTGSRLGVAAFAGRLQRPDHALDVRHVGSAAPAAPFLTASQDEAIRVAVASGYYDIPRLLNLHELGSKLGVTAASLSERLRRAEGRIIRQYVARDEIASSEGKAAGGLLAKPTYGRTVLWDESFAEEP